MHFPVDFLPSHLTLLAHLIFWPFFIEAILRARWQHLRDTHDSNVLFGAIVLTTVFWLLDAGIKPGIDFHLVLTPLLSLMFGRHFALISGTLVLALLCAFEQASWQTLPLNAFLFAVIPGLLTTCLFQISIRYLPHNYFIYIFVNAFFGAGLSILCIVMATCSVFLIFDVYTLEALSYDYIPFGLMMMFPEAFITGALLSLFVVYRPEWVSTFDDYRYLRRK